MLRIEWLVGTGGLLSHAPRRAQSAFMLIDAFQPEGITKLAQDSVFMMPHLGVMSTVHPKAAMEIFEKDCLVRIGTCIAPRGTPKKAETMMSIKVEMPDGKSIEEHPTSGSIKRIPLGEHQKAKMEIKPSHGFDIGNGLGRLLSIEVEGGVVGLIIDTRGRPLTLPEDPEQRRKKLVEWYDALDTYPKEALQDRA